LKGWDRGSFADKSEENLPRGGRLRKWLFPALHLYRGKRSACCQVDSTVGGVGKEAIRHWGRLARGKKREKGPKNMKRA